MIETFDLEYDPNEVGGDMVVECWISHGPRAGDATFDPQPGDWISVGDGEEPVRQARVVRRDGNRVRVQMNLPGAAQAVAKPGRTRDTRLPTVRRAHRVHFPRLLARARSSSTGTGRRASRAECVSPQGAERAAPAAVIFVTRACSIVGRVVSGVVSCCAVRW